ncbi:hypothetical protein VPH35_036615 [Triticum aestivum]|uniref:Uncharacterized protein n=1 Tax=Aegilops tauschii subsp. strangulata TaxID=200361 RepID=A0A453BEY8_AEGTS
MCLRLPITRRRPLASDDPRSPTRGPKDSLPPFRTTSSTASMGALARAPGLPPPPPGSSPRHTYCRSGRRRILCRRCAAGTSRMRFSHPVLASSCGATSSRRAASTREATESGIGSASLCIVFSREALVSKIKEFK